MGMDTEMDMAMEMEMTIDSEMKRWILQISKHASTGIRLCLMIVISKPSKRH